MRQAGIDEDDVAFAGVVGQAGMLRDGRLSAVDLVELLLARIARLDPGLHAFRVVMADEARAEAAAADQARREGDTRPLLGVPIAIKDTVDVAGHASMRGTGSPQPVATSDDELVRRLRQAGLVVLGKTHLPELALWPVTSSQAHGITRNPWDRRRSPGGSSGGSAAAVAAGLVPAAHATDGLGSIRIPASACGLVGLKPTHGLVPLGPDPDHWAGLSHAGFLTRSVRDTAVLLDAVTDRPQRLAMTLGAGQRRLRIATSTRTPTPTRLAAPVRAVFDQAARTLAGLGHAVTRHDPELGPGLARASSTRYLAGLASDVDDLTDPQSTERRTRTLAAMGRRLSPTMVARARARGDRLGRHMAEFFAETDLLLTPTMPVLPRAADALAGRGLAATLAAAMPCAAFTGPWNACGLPAVSLPMGTGPQGVPIGVQLVGAVGSESLLLAVAAELEPVTAWLERRPRLD